MAKRRGASRFSKRGRRPGTKAQLPRILVVTEGSKTEPGYLDGLRRHLYAQGSRVAVDIVKLGAGASPSHVVTKAIDRVGRADAGDEFDAVVCLVDVDQHGSDLQQACDLARANNIFVLVSNLKFEVWLLWHVATSRRARSSHDLDSEMKKHGLLNGKTMSLKFPYQRYTHAARTARQTWTECEPGAVGPDPSTAMPWLVDLLTGDRRISDLR
ncbi:RloB family protein [Helcobacillus massiliensis]|uniref:RloB family protein n=1 Tax=Helcobacillus massiliensis TaxID=521392 RepID=UPI0021A51AE1|nr:RloB family protein [Helcobacillus massiliensis]MCT1557603.1 RloB family protein [Helcobacillus massiliensis]MCT2037167.1 RloB family protein [Helcobacillus massiliensis]MCT2332419.1 RloB family protein [Helcobacillus massiliensis]